MKDKIKRQIPNMITWSRLGLLLGSIVSFVMGNYPLTFGLFVGSACTDKLDGTLARKFNCVSEFGAKLDGVCDKILSIVGGALTIPMGGKEFILPLCLEVLIASYNLYRYKIKKQNVETVKMGKIKTVILDATMALGIARPLMKLNPLVYASAIGVTLASQAATMASYVGDDIKQRNDNDKVSHLKIELKDNSGDEEQDRVLENNNENYYNSNNSYDNTDYKPMVRSRFRDNKND